MTSTNPDPEKESNADSDVPSSKNNNRVDVPRLNAENANDVAEVKEVQASNPEKGTSPKEDVKEEKRNSGKDEDDGDKETRVGKWTELMGEDLMMKVVESGVSSEAGSEGKEAEFGDAILVDFVGRRYNPNSEKNDGGDDLTSGEIFHEGKGWWICLGDGDVCPGLEMGIRFLRLNERGLVKCHSKYAYGPAGRRRGKGTGGGSDGTPLGREDYVLPPYSTVTYDIEVRSFVGAGAEEFETDAFRIQRALSKKQIGNDCYQNEWDGAVGKSKALKLYGKASELLIDLVNNIRERRTDPNDDAELEQEALSILIDCLNNIAALHLRARSYGLAKDSAAQVLQYDPNNMKALLRGAKAAMLDPTCTFEESDIAIAAAEEIDKDDEEVKKLRTELSRRKRVHRKKEKDLYTKMMKGGAVADAVADAVGDAARDGDGGGGTVTSVADKKSSEEPANDTKENRRERLILFGVALAFSVVFLAIGHLAMKRVEQRWMERDQGVQSEPPQSSLGNEEEEF